MLSCRPFHLSMEFTIVMITAVYIPPQANTKSALEQLQSAITNYMSAYPDSDVVAAIDINRASLKSPMPKFFKNVNGPTREKNTLDQFHTSIPGTYKAILLPHLGLLDHMSLSLILAYKPLICRQKPTIKTVQVWTEEALSALQDCFETTDWDIFAERTDLEVHTTAVLSYVNFCAENVVDMLTKVFPNQKLWLNSKVRTLLRARDSAFKFGSPLECREVQKGLRKGIIEAKRRYKLNIEEHFNNKDSRCIWQGI